MQETPQQYTRRVLGYLKGKEAMDILAATPRQLAQATRGVPTKKLSRRPAPDTWSARALLAHLADSEIVYGYRIRIILEASGSPLPGTDQDAWARFSDYETHDPALSLEAFRTNRERTVRLLRALPRKSWNRYGVHSERGKETLRRVVQMLAGHDLNHLMQIRQRLAAG